MGFKEQKKKVVGCAECRMHAVCAYCLGLLHRPKKSALDLRDEEVQKAFEEYFKENGWEPS